MRFLVDQCLSTEVARGLSAAGHDAVHVADCGLSRADDEVILERAESEQRVVVSGDTDFGALLADAGAPVVSAILYRRRTRRRPHEQLVVVLTNLAAIEADLDAGAVVIIEDGGMRVRRLPFAQ